MNNETFYVGLDLGSTRCYQVVMNEGGKIVRSRPFQTSEQNLRAAFQGFDGELRVHTEAGELADWVAGVIKPLVKQVVVSHPQSLAWIAKDARKCDKVDARKLADRLRCGLTHEVFLPVNQARRTFKQIVRHFDEATRAQAKLKAKLKARLRCQGIICRDSEVFTQAGREQVLQQISDKFLRQMVEGLSATLDALIEQMKTARQLMLESAKQFPEVRLLQTAPDVGVIGACRFVALVQNPHRFSNKRKLWRYCRLGVAHRSSDGKLLAHPRLDRNGCGALKDVSRKAFEAALRCREDNSFKRAFEKSLATTHDKIHARLWACLATVWALIATLIIVRNPFPFPDRGHRVFGVPDERARSVVVNVIENLSGKKSKYTFDSGQIHQTILGDGYTSIHYIDNRAAEIPANAISLAVENPLVSARKAIEMLMANGYDADLIEGIDMNLPPNHLIPVRSNAFESWTLVFRRPLLKMPRPKFR